jgi:hypothetical protein
VSRGLVQEGGQLVNNGSIAANDTTGADINGTVLSVRVRDDSTGLAYDERSSGNIPTKKSQNQGVGVRFFRNKVESVLSVPCMDSLLIVKIERAAGNVTHIERCRSGTTNGAAILQDDLDVTENPIERGIRAIVGKSGGGKAMLSCCGGGL